MTDKPLTYSELARIMEPYEEGHIHQGVYDEQWNQIRPMVHPQFWWDYYDIHEKIIWHNPSDCFALIDLTTTDWYCIARKWWNGRENVDQTQAFETYCRNNLPKWNGKTYMIELDIHW